MTLDADSIIDAHAVRRAVAYFEDPNVAGVAANVRVLYRQSVLGLLQQFEHLIGYRSKKFYSLTSSEIIVGGVASTYRKSILQEVGFYDTDTQTEDIGLSMKIAALGNTEHKLVYAVDVLAYTQGVHTLRALMKQRYRWKLGNLQNLIKYSHSFRTTNNKHSRMLTFYRVPMAYLGEVLLLMEPLLLGYVLYLSVLLRSPLMFVGSYMVISAYILLTVWTDEHYTAREKWHMTSYAPVMYFFFYIMDLVQFVAIVKCILHPKQMLLKAKTDGRWVSPERQGLSS
jgi:cellulose synthase/poly-beta-1,6-N-acetylglucosamine synthase-like glycosyltransferase